MAQRRWSSRYSVAASTLALVAALGGTAYAANTVFSADIVDGEVKSVDIGDSEVGTVDIANGAVGTVDIADGQVGTADAAPGSLGRSPRLWAQVRATGTIANGTALSASRPATGRYNVTFGGNVATCAISATPVTTGARSASAQRSGSTVVVRMFNANGVATNTPFDIVVVC
jgi:hypothetical protein